MKKIRKKFEKILKLPIKLFIVKKIHILILFIKLFNNKYNK